MNRPEPTSWLVGLGRSPVRAWVAAMNRRYRVLSLDGGGIKGVFSAAVLAELEEMTGKRIVEHFDLIVGTSTGGIITLALGLDVPAPEILQLYEQNGADIFRGTGSLARPRGWWRPRHSPEALRAALAGLFGGKRLADARCRLVIPAFDVDSGQVHVFKTGHHPRIRQDPKELAVDVALATSAAPIFFPVHVSARGKALVDGGVWATCPVSVALLECQCVLRWPLDRVDVLSIGTTAEPFHVPGKLFRLGLLGWRKTLLTLLLVAQQQAALAQAKLLVGESLLRVDETVAPGRFKLDEPRRVRELRSVGISAARHLAKVVERRFLSSPAPTYPENAVTRDGSQ